jgi:hypothetical protein
MNAQGEKSFVEKEIYALETLCRNIFFELDDLNVEKERLLYSYTWRGKYYNVLGYIFSAYCIYKLIMCSINIIFDRVGKTDPVTYSLSLVAFWLNMKFDAEFWSQYISFILIGILIVASIRGLLLQFMKFFQAVSSSLSRYNIVLFLAQIMGSYFLSSVLLIRMSLPPSYRTIISDVLGKMEFSFYHRWFDIIFLISALASIGILALLHLRKGDVIGLHEIKEDDPTLIQYETKISPPGHTMVQESPRMAASASEWMRLNEMSRVNPSPIRQTPTQRRPN